MYNFALVLTGHMRCWEKVFPNTLDKFLNVYNPDVFISTWDDEGYWVSPENDPDNKGISSYSPKLDIAKVNSFYEPVEMEVESFDVMRGDFEHLASNLSPYCDQIRPMNIVSQFYKIHRGYNLLADHVMKTGKQYDWVIRMRPDLIINGKLPFPEDLNIWNGNEVLTIAHQNHKGQGIGDMFLMTNFTYSMLFNSLLTLYPRIAMASKQFCPHVITEKLIAGLPEHKHYNENIEKIIMHTPNGQYKDVSKDNFP